MAHWYRPLSISDSSEHASTAQAAAIKDGRQASKIQIIVGIVSKPIISFTLDWFSLQEA